MSLPLLNLLSPIQLGPYTLRNRVVMAPLTRMRAGEGNVPTALNAEYYRQRASAGLIITEATPVSPFGHGYYRTPGIHTEEQTAGWRKVADTVHQEGGRIFLQLWHVGRMSHPDLLPGGELPLAPSAVSAAEEAYTREGPKPHPVPRAMTLADIQNVIEEFRLGAENALKAGFDGVEIHGANGYLLDQFLADNANLRTDQYGGTIENRCRLFLEVVEAVIGAWGQVRVGVRISPAGRHGNIHPSDRWGQYSYLVRRLAEWDLAYLHIVEPRVNDSEDVASPDLSLSSAAFRPLFPRTTRLISAGGHTRDTGEQAVASGNADLIAYGRLFLANPDLPSRLALNAPLNSYDRSTFYDGDARGYTDYPSLALSKVSA